MKQLVKIQTDVLFIQPKISDKKKRKFQMVIGAKANPHQFHRATTTQMKMTA